jgi:hypothetical protein
MFGDGIGPLVGVDLLPRFSSYVGEGEYATAPMDVERFAGGWFTFWRGPLIGGGGTPFETYCEESHDCVTWSTVTSVPTQPITTANASDKVSIVLRKRWFRVRVVLDGDANNVVAISMWMTGTWELRVPPGSA